MLELIGAPKGTRTPVFAVRGHHKNIFESTRLHAGPRKPLMAKVILRMASLSLLQSPSLSNPVAGTLPGHCGTTMARHIRASNLESRSARLKLPVAKKPVFTRIGDGVGLGYRRNQTAGVWVVRAADGKGGNWTKAFATADDFDDADGGSILNFWQAQDRGRGLASGGKNANAEDGRLVSVQQALERYQTDLQARGGDKANAARVRFHLPVYLANETVAFLTARDLRHWRDSLTEKGLSPASINRSCAAFKAALNLAASLDDRVVNRRAWETGLTTIPDAVEARNIVVPEADILKIIRGAYEVGADFGLLVEVDAVTGARPSQLCRLEVQDMQIKRADPRLMMPSSRKGRGKKKISRQPVPIPLSLAERLQQVADGRPADAPLLRKSSGEPWKRSDHTRLFAQAVALAGLDPAEITIYALRHSNIIRQLLSHVPIRVVAVNHDTSVAMIEKNYSRYIADHSDAVTRAALLDPALRSHDGNVVPLARAANS